MNRAYLEKVASLAGGKSYFLNEPAGLEQILLKDVMEHTGSTAVEKTLRPIVAKNAEILDGVGIDTRAGAQRLRPVHQQADRGHHSQGRRKGSAAGALAVRPGPRRGFHFRCQEPLGRRLGDLERLRQALDQHLPRSAAARRERRGQGRVRQRERRSGGELSPRRRCRRSRQAARDLRSWSRTASSIRCPSPSSAAKSYRGTIHIGDLQGLFRIRPLDESRAFPEVGFYRPEQELLDYGSNEFLLRSVSQFTGGRFNPAPKQVFDSAGRSESSTLRLWPMLLGLAIALNLAELLMRKVRPRFPGGMFGGKGQPA